MCEYCERDIDLARGYRKTPKTQKELEKYGKEVFNQYVSITMVKRDEELWLCAANAEDNNFNLAIIKINFCPMCGRKSNATDIDVGSTRS